jgi:SAM-dependent methyltransferase
MSKLLNDAGYSVTSIDLFPEHFAVAELDCHAADLHLPLKFPDDSFEVVLAIEVMEHLENPWHFLREAVRVTARNGHVIFTTPNVVSLPSRCAFALEALFPYFRDESFRGCYHVTPIFPWAVERCCTTTTAVVESISYSRADWPRKSDIPRHDGGFGFRRKLLDVLPLNATTGEISCFKIRKTESDPTTSVGVHTA